MKRESYDKARMLVSRIDELSDSANMVSEILESVKKNGGIAKIYTHTGGTNYETELASKSLEVVFADVLNSYHALIRDAKNEIDNLIEGVIKG